MIAEYKRKSGRAAYVCLGVLAVATLAGMFGYQPNTRGAELLGAVLGCVLGISFVYAAWFYIKAKGRSGWWILLLLLNLVGIVILALLKRIGLRKNLSLALCTEQSSVDDTIHLWHSQTPASC
jgi:uncharacterized membrane protein HdeD (DUF308 family)